MKMQKKVLEDKAQGTGVLRICVPITRFPVTGGTRTVLANVAKVMADQWQLEYITQGIGPDPEGFIIYRFGTAYMSPWQFPTVWLYSLAGFRRLISLMRHGITYDVILPQDGVFTAAFAAIAGKLVGVRVVCIDHGNLTLLNNPGYRAERMGTLSKKSWPSRLLYRLLYTCYWPSLHILARISARYVDHFLIPGIPGDGVEDDCKSLGIQDNRITRFASMIDIDRYGRLDNFSKAQLLAKFGFPSDAIVIAMICRLSPAKGIDIALDAISQALSSISPMVCAQVRVVIMGDGPLHAYVEEVIHCRGLDQTFLLWGEGSPEDVVSLLGISDIFLYTSTRGACLSMAVLEAMASGCAVVASTLPLANAQMLAEGRGITVPPGEIGETKKALLRLLNEEGLRKQMGWLARDYVARHHNADVFKQVLTEVICRPKLYD
jgi:glycosyltransferase involved in cell wall biosynthesis